MRAFSRKISLLGRKMDSASDRRRVLKKMAAWKAAQDLALPPVRTHDERVLIIRLDDIGDYLLFRNQLAVYKRSAKWRDHEITLLGNDSWRDLCNALDADAVDAIIWVNKHRYLKEDAYRLEIWQRLRESGFSTVIAASRTRPLLLDDLCMLAACPRQRMGVVNTNVHASWNVLSDALYTSLFIPPNPLQHEFQFNAEFTEWACGIRSTAARPHIEWRVPPPVQGPYIVCFVGASIASKRWPIRRWVEFIVRYRRSHAGEIVLAGNGRTEVQMVRLIQKRVAARSIAGAVSLTELLTWVAGADAVVTNDTMTAHLGASLGTPTVIIANGINYMRFSEYQNAGIDSVATVYPEVVSRRRRLHGDGLYEYSETVTADIESISVAAVMAALDGLLAQAAGRTDQPECGNAATEETAANAAMPG
jgi:ADP-heptose:LPS heptosyltransferase